MTAVLQTFGLEKRFGAVCAAENIEITVERGEIVGVIGANGAGKTTFINMVTGYLKPSGGRILIDGREIGGLAPRDVCRAGVGRSFQVPQLFPELTAQENLLIARDFARNARPGFWAAIHASSAEREADERLASYGIAEFARARVQTLPQGVRKLLDIAMATVARPKLLLLDEPTSGVASDAKYPMMDTIMERVDRVSSATLFVEHDMEVVERYADRVLAFYDGKVIADGPSRQVLSDPKVQELVVGHAPVSDRGAETGRVENAVD
jgi:branched-chain amino acid transport system ATP-binding protein